MTLFSMNISVQSTDLHKKIEADKIAQQVYELEERICELENENASVELVLDRLYRKRIEKYFVVGSKLKGTLFKYAKPGHKDLIHKDLMHALLSYTGPAAFINSIHRPSNPRSLHKLGRAVDLQVTETLVDWLVSDEGAQWRSEFGIRFFLEDNKNSRIMKTWKSNPKTSPFVFVNPKATGLHVHLDLKYNTI